MIDRGVWRVATFARREMARPGTTTAYDAQENTFTDLCSAEYLVAQGRSRRLAIEEEAPAAC